MVVIITEIQVSWWKPWTRRTLVSGGKNFDESYAALKKLTAERQNYKFTNSLKVYQVN